MAYEGLHVLVDPGRVRLARLPAFVAAIARGGATVLQVRIKAGETRDALRYAAEARSATRTHHLRLIINDRVDWALAVDADGVHLGQGDMPADMARRLAPTLDIGLSAGTEAEVRASLPYDPAYVGIGPVYGTPSKADAGAPLGVDEFRRLAALTLDRAPVVAIGGLHPENAAPVWAAGARALAVIQAVTENPDPEGACRALLAARRAPSP